MKWQKLGPIWSAKNLLDWGQMGTLTPTPYLMSNGTIRVYCGIRDSSGIGRIGFFDVNEDNPTEIITYSQKPILDIGEPGTFDDNGMLLGDIIKVDDEIRMYYVGFQLAKRVKFHAFGGLAISSDNGETFQRFQRFPIIDRDESGLFIRAIHGIRKIKNDQYKIWFSEGAGWELINKIPYPHYSIATLISTDGITFPGNLGKSINLQKKGEYRVGRSRVFSFEENKHILTFTYGTVSGLYQSGYAISNDLSDWKRMDDWGLDPGSHAFDSRHLAYPAIIKNSSGDIFCFYNGNDMGAGGIGVAKLLEY